MGAEKGKRSWNIALLTPTEPGRRNRRTVDAFFLVVGAIVAGLTAVVASSAPGTEADIAQALGTVLGWAGGSWRTVFVGLLVLALFSVADTIARQRFDLTRDVLVALLLLAGTGTILGGIRRVRPASGRRPSALTLGDTRASAGVRHRRSSSSARSSCARFASWRHG
jgi:hypothetical protein